MSAPSATDPQRGARVALDPDPPSRVRLVYSNRTERLVAALASDLRGRTAAGFHPLDPVDLVVPNRNMETYVRFGLAQHLGVAANLRFHRLERFVGALLADVGAGRRILDRDALQAFVLAVLLDDEALATPELQPVQRYVQGGGVDADGQDLRRVQLAARLAHLFDEYGYSRAELLQAWRAGGRLLAGHPELAALEGWQRALWLRIFAPGGLAERFPPVAAGAQTPADPQAPDGPRWTTLEALLRDASAEPPARAVHVFGVSYVARLFQQVFAWLGQVVPVHLYALNPCREFWEDVETDAELRARVRGVGRGGRAGVGPGGAGDGPGGRARVGREVLASEEDPYLLATEENTPLRLWGRPGRENVRLLDELTDCDFDDRFEAPTDGGETLLRVLQRDILNRAPEPAQPACPERAADGSLVLVEAPGIRREVEHVADEIWRLVHDGDGRLPPLRFSDVAVIVNATDRDLYVPHLDAVFDEVHAIPRSVVDLPITSESLLVEAASLLLELPFGRYSRSELLRIMTHPAVLGRWDDVAPDDWVHLAEDAGIYLGADRSDHDGTYVTEDVLSWDQGVRRLVLGAFMTGERSGDDRIYEGDGGRRLPAEVAPSSQDLAARFGLLARGLLAEARAAREARLPLTAWSARFRGWLQAFLEPQSDADVRDLARCLSALQSLEALDLDGRAVSCRVAASLAGQALSGLSASRGSYLAEGVVVSSFLPMRAIPFRAVFVLGLGEGRFPAASRRDPLDLRAGGRRAGDVTPAERDRYTFLETLLSARDRLYLSWVGRDEQTGDALQPSTAVQELADLLSRGYVGEAGLADLRHRPPLRRHQDPASTHPAAPAEDRARQLGDALRQHTGRGDAAEDPLALRPVLPAGPWAGLARLLGLPALPPAEGAAALPDRLQLSLSQLRGFLESPLQGAAAAVLGLERKEEGDLASLEDEPTTLDRLRDIVTLRETFVAAGRTGRPIEALHEAQADRLALGGRLPTGVLGHIERAGRLSVLQGWQAALAGALGEPAPALRRLGLGRAAEHDTVDQLLPAVVLEVQVPGRAQPVLVELHGRTEVLAGAQGASVVLARHAPKCDRVWKLKQALRGFVDHVALAAAGGIPGAGSGGPDGAVTGDGGAGERRVVVCAAKSVDAAAAFGFRLAPLSQAAARAWLGSVVGELLEGVHAYRLPCEAVFQSLQKGSTELNGEAIAAKAEALWDDARRGGGSDRYGPVPHPERYEAPDPEAALALATRRLGLFLETAEEEEA